MSPLNITHHHTITAGEFTALYGKMNAEGKLIKPNSFKAAKLGSRKNTAEFIPVSTKSRTDNSEGVKARRQQFFDFLAQDNPISQHALGQWLLRATSTRHDLKHQMGFNNWCLQHEERFKMGPEAFRQKYQPDGPKVTPICLLNNLRTDEKTDFLDKTAIAKFIVGLRHKIKQSKPALVILGTHGGGGTSKYTWRFSKQNGDQSITIKALFNKPRFRSYQSSPVLIGACTSFGPVLDLCPETYIPAELKNKQVYVSKPDFYVIKSRVYNQLTPFGDTFDENQNVQVLPESLIGHLYRDYVKKTFGVTLPSKANEWIPLPK